MSMNSDLQIKLGRFIDNNFTSDQKQALKELIEDENKNNPHDKHFKHYSVLGIALLEDMEEMTDSEVEDFYYSRNCESECREIAISRVDKLIAQIINTLSSKMSEDVYAIYEDKTSIGQGQPEFEYLIDAVNHYLSL